MGIRKNVNRRPPSDKERVEALFDIKKFANLIYFHGGLPNFGQIHIKGLEWVKSHVGDDVIRELILMPRSHLKTTIFTILDVLHQIYINPNIRCYIGSANQNLSKAILREITANLTDPWLIENVWDVRPHFQGRLVPLMDKGAKQRRMVRMEENGEWSDYEEELLAYQDDKKKIWRQEAIQVIRPYKLKEPTVVIGSVESPATGFHYDRLYFDDIINFDNYDKPEKIERLDVWRNDMLSVLDDAYVDDDLVDAIRNCSREYGKSGADCKRLATVGGFVRVVGTRYFRHDWYKQIIDSLEDPDVEDFAIPWKTWVQNIYKNGENDENGYIWHERWTKRNEMIKRKEMTKKHFYAQYLNKVIVEEEQILPMDLVRGLHPGQIEPVRPGSSRVLIKLADEEKKVEVNLRMCVDPAATCNPDSDYTAIAVGGKDSLGRLFIVDLRIFKVTSHTWIKKMYEMLDNWNLKTVHLETVAFAAELKNTIRDNFFKSHYPISIRDYKPGVLASKKERIEAGLEPLARNSMLFLPLSAFNHSEISDQFNFFPSDTVKDDAPDVVQMVNEVAKKTNVTDNKIVPMNKYNKRWGGCY